MQIQVVSATGTGPTSLAAFDQALKNCGVHNFNIIPLSSVIPTGARVVTKKKFLPDPDKFGHRLYVVMADIRTSESNLTIGSGLGWYLLPNDGGVFVEHKAGGLSPESVENDLRLKITASLQGLCKNRRQLFNASHVNLRLSVAPPSPHPRCALTIAVYKSEPW